ncbi:hypothetical protein RHSIM_Rhsim12G0209300 [Rhododendron simsii]|uniref:TRF-like 6 n=1 Tax=Rhododendron simsii TaxID=118357 RepID=A0A834G2D9_RHOSS|nr:hypothetical protein RHSIM_Rhsim12G0209300 [Rhododendron simsii]
METVVGVEGNDEANLDHMPDVKTSPTPSSPTEIADPVVYTLVRVDGDGRLVPATDDEVMQVEDLLEDDKCEIHTVADTGQNVDVGCASSDGFPSSNCQLDGSEGQPEKPEEVVEAANGQHDAGVGLGELNAGPEETVPLIAKSDDGHIDQPESGGECSNPLAIENGSPVSAVCTNSKPDFSKLKGEICLDNLSVRELHETFKATFGRETSVKDKQWLKRRIAMGLTNSCDFSTTAFVIKDNKVVMKKGKEVIENVDGALAGVSTVEAVNENCGDSLFGCNGQVENLQKYSGERLGNSSLEHDISVEDQQTDQRAAKRLRKPTRRYIEELSEVESKEYGGKLISSVQSSEDGQSPLISHARPIRHTQSNGRPVVTRQDSLGGSGVQVPYVCRVRRSRPRENFMSLMKLQPSSMGMATKLVKKALGARGARQGNQIGNKVFKARSVSAWIQKPLVTESEKEEHYQVRKASELENDAELKHVDSSGDYSDDYVVSVPTEKGGMRRKHHRPWTLSEVVKLVEGVARYGAGRWSEIKRLAFASYSYRTSVDLKDKWRNLLRASFAQSPADKGMQSSRKHASVPIPAAILLRVRELAEIQAQVPPNISSSKFAAYSSTNVHETRSGYL